MTFGSTCRAGVIALAVMTLTGCAGDAGDGYPKMTDFSRITQKVLTPQEQEKAIRDMTAEQQAEQKKAVKEIERR